MNFLKNILVVMHIAFLPLQAMQVIAPAEVTSRAVLEEDKEPERCSMRNVLSRVFTSFKQCFTRKKYADSSSGRMAALLDNVTVQTLGVLGGVQIAYLTSMDPSLMVLIGGMATSLLKDYFQGASREQLKDSFEKKFLIAGGTSFGGIIFGFGPIVLIPIILVVSQTGILYIPADVLSTDTFATVLAQSLSEEAPWLFCILLAIEFDLLTDFLAGYEISLCKYFNKKDWAKTAVTIVPGLLGRNVLAAELGKNLVLGVIFFGFTLESLSNFVAKDIFNQKPKFLMLQNRENANSCAICLNDFTEKESVALLPCEHVLHGDCLSGALKNKKACPLCCKKFKPSEVQMVIFAIPIDEKTVIKAD